MDRPGLVRTITHTTTAPSCSTRTATISKRCAIHRQALPASPDYNTSESENGPSPCPPQRIRVQLLARFRRRLVDAGALDRVPALGVSGGAVLPVSGSDRQGQGARATQRQDRATQRFAVAGEAGQAQSRRSGLAA